MSNRLTGRKRFVHRTYSRGFFFDEEVVVLQVEVEYDGNCEHQPGKCWRDARIEDLTTTGPTS